jgi:hypothetical protein
MLKLLLLFTLITYNCFATIQTQQLNDWENCGSSSDHIHDLNISYSPEIISKGDTINLKITGNLDEDVTSGEIDYKVLIGRFPVYQGTIQICSELKCPLSKGPLTLSTSQKVPDQIIPGKYEIQSKGTDQGGQEIFCAVIHIQAK